MAKIGSYEIIETLSLEKNRTLYKVYDYFKTRKFVLKIVNQDHDYSMQLYRFKNEFENSKDLPKELAIRAIAMETINGLPAIFLEDRSESTLKEYLKNLYPIKLVDRLNLCRVILELVQKLHTHGIVHKEINPYTIVRTVEGEFCLSEFGISGIQNRAQEVNLIGIGNPYYISPEQSGRITGVVDYRTDIYSLSAPNYE